MSAKEVTGALAELQAEGWIMLDEQADMILDRRALEFFPPKGTKQIAGAVRVIANAPKTTLKIELLTLAHINAPDLAEAITEECPELVNPALNHEGTHGYPIDTPSIPRGRDRARQLGDGVRAGQLEVETAGADKQRLKEKHHIQMVSEGRSR